MLQVAVMLALAFTFAYLIFAMFVNFAFDVHTYCLINWQVLVPVLYRPIPRGTVLIGTLPIVSLLFVQRH